MSSNGLGTSIAHISLRGVRRTTSPRQVSNPPGKYNMCHSLRCKQIDMSTANDLKSIFPNNARGTCTCNLTESKLVERLKIRSVIMIIKCEVSFTPPNVYLSILQAHAGQIVSLLRVNRTSETLSEP